MVECFMENVAEKGCDIVAETWRPVGGYQAHETGGIYVKKNQKKRRACIGRSIGIHLRNRTGGICGKEDQAFQKERQAGSWKDSEG